MTNETKYPVSMVLPSLRKVPPARSRVKRGFLTHFTHLCFGEKTQAHGFFPRVYNVLPEDSLCIFTQFTHFTQHIVYAGKSRGSELMNREVGTSQFTQFEKARKLCDEILNTVLDVRDNILPTFGKV